MTACEVVTGFSMSRCGVLCGSAETKRWLLVWQDQLVLVRSYAARSQEARRWMPAVTPGQICHTIVAVASCGWEPSQAVERAVTMMV